MLAALARQQRMTALGQWRAAGLGAEQLARIAREDGKEEVVASSLAGAAADYTMAGDPEAGVDLAVEALELARSVGAPMTIGLCLTALAGTLAETEPLQARALLEEALALRERLHIESVTEVTQATLIAARMADWPLTLKLADRSIRHIQWGGERPWLAGILNVVARALVASDVEAAARLQGAARHLGVQLATSSQLPSADPGLASPRERSARFSMITDLRRQTSQLLHDALDEQRLRQLRAEGEAMDSDQAAAYALDTNRRARQSQHTDDV
jgi:hypothetical protein